MDVEFSFEEVNEITKRARVSIPAETITAQLESELQEISKKADIKGFRPGKAPRHIVEKLYGKKVRAEVTNRLVSQSLQDLVREQEIKMVNCSSLDVDTFEPGSQLKYTAELEVFPEPEIKNTDKFKIEVERKEISEPDVDKVVEQHLESKATLKKVEFRTSAKVGDVIDASVLIKREGTEAGRPEPINIPLGEGKLPKELEEGIPGMETGEQKSIMAAGADGKEVEYVVSLNGLFEKVLPPLTDESVKELGFDVETVLELRMKARDLLEKARESEEKSEAQYKIIEALIESNDFMVPQAIVDDEIRWNLVNYGVIDPKKQDPKTVSMEPYREGLDEMARKRVKTAIIVDRIGEAEKVEVSEEDINVYIGQVAQQNGVSEDQVRKVLLQDQQRANVMGELRRNKVLDILHSRAEIKHVKPKKKTETEKADKSSKEQAGEAEKA